jgi:hypothetical protein
MTSTSLYGHRERSLCGCVAGAEKSQEGGNSYAPSAKKGSFFAKNQPFFGPKTGQNEGLMLPVN